MANIYVFDIDGTLVSSGGAGRRSICTGLATLLNRSADEVEPRFSFSGMTDRAILGDALEACGEEVDEARIDAALKLYVEALPREVDRAVDYRVLPGVRELLIRLNGLSSTAVGLGTGNARQGAKIKLHRGGLDGYFHFGGYGCEAADRAEVIRRAIYRGAEQMQCDRSDCEIVIIGDTPADIAAADANDAKSLAVATGSWSQKDLMTHNPTWLVDTLEHPEVTRVLSG